MHFRFGRLFQFSNCKKSITIGTLKLKKKLPIIENIFFLKFEKTKYLYQLIPKIFILFDYQLNILAVHNVPLSYFIILSYIFNFWNIIKLRKIYSVETTSILRLLFPLKQSIYYCLSSKHHLSSLNGPIYCTFLN